MGSHFGVYIGPCIYIPPRKSIVEKTVNACEKCGDQCETKFCALCGGVIKPTVVKVPDKRSVWELLDDADLSGAFTAEYDYIILRSSSPYQVRLSGDEEGFADIPKDPGQSIFQELTNYLDANGITWEYKFGALGSWR